MKSILDLALEQLDTDGPVSHGALHLFPLTGGPHTEDGLLLLGEAMQAGIVEAVEVDDEGSVPYVRVINKGDRSVLILDGDELIGARQNRVANSSVLLPAETEVILPVSCVERGRWSRSTAAFLSGDSSPHTALRRLNSRVVRESLIRGRGHVGDQNAVWEEVDHFADAYEAPSPTRALQDSRSQLSGLTREFLELSEGLPSGTRGIAIFVGSRPIAVEVLPGPRCFTRAVGKLLSGYAFAAIEAGRTGVSAATPGAAHARTLLEAMARADREEHPGVGDGRDVRLRSTGVIGHALVTEKGLMHAVAFAD